MSNEANFTYQIPIGVHKVEHKIRDSYNNEASHITLVRITDYVLDWQMTMSGCAGPNYESNFGKVTVSVITNGKEYRSDKVTDNLQNNFQVSNIEYVGNANGDPARAVFDISFDAKLVDESGTDYLSLTDMTGTFNVGLQ